VQIFGQAAAALEEDAMASASAEVAKLLADLGWRPDDPCGDRAHLAAIFRAASRLDRIFGVSPPDAPGMTVFGATAAPAAFGAPGHRPVHISGRGLRPIEAVASCVGEAVEHLAFRLWQSRTGLLSPASEGRIPSDFPAQILAPLSDGQPMDASEAFAPALEDGFRRPDVAWGSAAGRTQDEAVFGAILEVIERDAAALWWKGGRQPAHPPLEAMSAAARLLETARRNARSRRTWLLDVTTNLGVPVVAAVSVNAAGRRFAVGLSARPALADAAATAVIELCQMEFADELVVRKHETGHELTPDEERRLHRSTNFDAAETPLLQPRGLSAADQDPPRSELTALVERLSSRGYPGYALDVTAPEFHIPCAVVLVPGLQALHYGRRTERLEKACAQNDGQPQSACEFELM
jgi:ribosomal protein S12 methylthiotransferase accessory factor